MDKRHFEVSTMGFVRSMVIISIAACSLFADKIATTDDGKKVILHDNFRWEFQTESTRAEPVAQPDTKRMSLVELIKNEGSFDFRQVRWGMSKKEVLNAEKAQLVKNGSDTLTYEVQFLGYDCSVLYIFIAQKLSKAVFLIQQSHVDPSLFYKDFDELKKYLSPLYGSAVSDRYDWKNEIYKNDKSKWGFAISIGFLTCRTDWQNDRTRIELRISGANHQISTTIEYTSLVN